MKNQNQTVSKKLIGTVSVIIAVGMLLVTAVSAVSLYNLSVSQSLNTLEQSTDALTNKVDGYISGIKMLTNQNAVVGKDLLAGGNEQSREAYLGYLTNTFLSNEDFADVYVGLTDGTFLDGSGFVPDADYDARQRPWYKSGMADPGNVVVTAPYYDIFHSTLALAFTKAIGGNGDTGITSIDLYLTTAEKMVSEANTDKNINSTILNANGDVYISTIEDLIPDSKTGEFKNLATYGGGGYSAAFDGLKSGEAFSAKDSSGAVRYYASAVMPSTGWYVLSSVPASAILSQTMQTVAIMFGLFVLTLIAAVFILRSIVGNIVVSPVRKLCDAAEHIAAGSIDVKIDGRFTGEFENLNRAFGVVIKDVREQANILHNISQGDYTGSVGVRSSDDILSRSINELITKVNSTLHQIEDISHDVERYADGVSGMAARLASATSEQAASVEEISASIADVYTKTTENTKTADEAATLADDIKTAAEKGSEQMSEMTKAVQEISAASNNIGKVIKVIDDIAFQTNILALNAAVEAARAGEAGKGFAVVADEVRSLASKSADAAKETNVLIADVVKKSTAGAKIADDTAVSLAEIVSGIQQSTVLINKMAKYGKEQHESVAQIESAVQTVADVIQQSSASAQESADYSDELNNVSSKLVGQISTFKLKQL
ncbi:hypothetical protein FACS1894120_3320 [Clostridia bacterium]|nr:hypothetical protein FACS1894120_3320 [Clostridia bacterium]